MHLVRVELVVLLRILFERVFSRDRIANEEQQSGHKGVQESGPGHHRAVCQEIIQAASR